MSTSSKSNSYHALGYDIIRGVFSQDLIVSLNEELSDLDALPESYVYYDRLNNVRRVEHFAKSCPVVNQIVDQLIPILHNLYGFDFCLFKDKLNYKPPGGEGFLAHYDGVFRITESTSSVYNGWYKYADLFVNVLLPLDPFTTDNGCLQISPIHKLSFDDLILNTFQDGTPNLIPDVEKDLDFVDLIVSPSDVIIFDSRCPHRSQPNHSSYPRSSLYLTFNPLSSGDHYDQYFIDKNSSSSPYKALTGKL